MTESSGEENPMMEELLQRPCRRICYHQHPATYEKTIPVHAVWNNFGEFHRVPFMTSDCKSHSLADQPHPEKELREKIENGQTGERGKTNCGTAWTSNITSRTITGANESPKMDDCNPGSME
jgi:hypothetical protein